MISEHSFGVQAIAFSPDSKLLATLGTVNDGFLHIWEIDERSGAATLIATNKCTNVVRQIVWIGRNLITVGVRFVKVWRPDESSSASNTNGDQTCVLSSPGHKPLFGRNTLLGELLEATFTTVVGISDSKAITCADNGDVCLLDDSEKQQRLSKVAAVDFGVTAACTAANGQLLVSGVDGRIEMLCLEQLLQETSSRETPNLLSPKKASYKRQTQLSAIGWIDSIVVTVDNGHSIQLRQPSTTENPPSFPVMNTLAAHSDQILGIRALPMIKQQPASFLTWSSEGSVIGWNSNGKPTFNTNVPLEQVNDVYNMTNELKSVSSVLHCSFIVTGDKYGVLR